MSYAGHVLDMIQRMRNNRNMVSKRERLFSGLNKRIIHSYRHHESHQKHQLSADEKLRLRQQLIHENRIGLIKNIIVLGLALTIVVALFVVVSCFLDLKDFMIYSK